MRLPAPLHARGLASRVVYSMHGTGAGAGVVLGLVAWCAGTPQAIRTNCPGPAFLEDSTFTSPAPLSPSNATAVVWEQSWYGYASLWLMGGTRFLS